MLTGNEAEVLAQEIVQRQTVLDEWKNLQAGLEEWTTRLGYLEKSKEFGFCMGNTFFRCEDQDGGNIDFPSKELREDYGRPAFDNAIREVVTRLVRDHVDRLQKRIHALRKP